MLNKKEQKGSGSEQNKETAKKTVVVPYMHSFSRNLKKIANRIDVKLVLAFSAPMKFGSLCAIVNSEHQLPQGCTTMHRGPFVPCTQGAVYSIPLSCGKYYIGQTGRCLNERLLEHHGDIQKTAIKGHLAAHCRQCKQCGPNFSDARVITKHKEKTTREIIEALLIKKAGE